ncbi:MAG: hypothetical protein A3C90_03030 [Candidatus Magasanikbacteria bacterium RIFCSPHIGHO2_02_FULL_51_14]|uniref:DUF5671 domain-containing protein n=1 Tax=Candidatus Magasanikbacteria bacterium RIFCSPHIGHO2_02_FULL_51_14 TaxID=1798683 RepID=A0A1F6MQV4_9BACT|nr:MAG: hypothetical protein A3C90_03030 [Candidatus Magasanikbacteria bacterium RIFCSPHIGHO2_02_FULL_51_14]
MLRRGIFIRAMIGFAIAFLFLYGAPPVIAATGDSEAPTLEGQVFEQLRAGAGATEKAAAPPDPRLLAARVIQIALAGLGVVFTILLLISGYWFFTAKGEEEKVTKAKDTARRAITGLIIIMIAYSLTVYIVGALQGVVREGEGFFRRR